MGLAMAFKRWCPVCEDNLGFHSPCKRPADTMGDNKHMKDKEQRETNLKKGGEDEDTQPIRRNRW